MASLTRKKTVHVRYGMVCDCCGKRDEDGLNDFVLGHTMGFDSPMDMTHVSASICDACLLAIVLDRVPGAVLTSPEGTPESRERAAGLLRAYLERRAAAVTPGETT
jgi:hypothetical protein